MNYGDDSTNMVSCLIYYASYSDGSGSVTTVEIVSNSIVPNVGAFLGLLSNVLFIFFCTLIIIWVQTLYYNFGVSDIWFC